MSISHLPLRYLAPLAFMAGLIWAGHQGSPLIKKIPTCSDLCAILRRKTVSKWYLEYYYQMCTGNSCFLKVKDLSNTVLPLQMGEGLLSFCTSSGRASPLKCLCSKLVYVWFAFKWQEDRKCASPVAVIQSFSWGMCQQGCSCWPWWGDWAELSLKVLLPLEFPKPRHCPLLGKRGKESLVLPLSRCKR